MSSGNYYSSKVNAERKRRAQRRKQANAVPFDICLSDGDDTDSDDMGDISGRISTDNVAVTTTSTHHSVCDYILDDDDDIKNDLKFVDNSSQLFSNRKRSVICSTKTITNFATTANLDKQNTMKLPKIMKSLLPQSNYLPTSLKTILKTFGRNSSFCTKYICERYGYDTINMKYGTRRCSNSKCLYYKQNLFSRRVIEIVTLDIRAGSHEIMKTNAKLFLKEKI
ncbi:unnamed protein product [Rotaria magnacalcarata]|uniref:Uncharacterized protein n=1 Tax=Rotaria magnacalcarata TaxID=392030 RepID=A0A816PUS7_9BILA|nr:unnamed protein product [Rotaria magnacalcarata]CAF4348198.1 unnamed protein product [Rotaria magnacalcarata]